MKHLFTYILFYYDAMIYIGRKTRAPQLGNVGKINARKIDRDILYRSIYIYQLFKLKDRRAEGINKSRQLERGGRKKIRKNNQFK